MGGGDDAVNNGGPPPFCPSVPFAHDDSTHNRHHNNGYVGAFHQVTRHEFKSLYRCGPRYTWGTPPAHEVLRSLRPKGYLSHLAAAHVHGLTGPTSIVYWNDEQSPKPRAKGSLNQGRIHLAFKNSPRLSANQATYAGQTLCILSGMHTEHLGVIEYPLPDGSNVMVTNLERTLIDLTVRPAYAGGPQQVLACYKKAFGRLSVVTLAELLKELDYVYPYHQAVGFYLSRSAKYPAVEIQPIRRMRKRFDFYLAHDIMKPAYCKDWRIYYPTTLDD